jgi:hypothetical protein
LKIGVSPRIGPRAAISPRFILPVTLEPIAGTLWVIGSGWIREIQLPHHRREHFILFRMAMARQGKLDLHRRVLHHRNPEASQGHDEHPAGLHHGNGGAGAIEEKLLHRRQLRLPAAEQHAQVGGDFHKPLSFLAVWVGADQAAVEHLLLAAAGAAVGTSRHLDHAIAHTGQAGIQAKDAHEEDRNGMAGSAQPGPHAPSCRCVLLGCGQNGFSMTS